LIAVIRRLILRSGEEVDDLEIEIDAGLCGEQHDGRLVVDTG
jgi:hypothetical protein